jgi:hypothetical protein
MEPEGRTPLIPSMQRELPPRGNRRVLMWIGLGAVVAVVLLILWTSKGKQPIVRDLIPDRPPPEQTIVGSPSTSPDALRYPSSYVHEPPAPPAAPAPEPGGPPPVQQTQPVPVPTIQPPPRPAVLQAPQVTIQAPPARPQGGQPLGRGHL